MESFILICAVVASAVGTLILLLCLAARRAELIEAFNLQQEAAAREQSIADGQGAEGNLPLVGESAAS